MVLATRSVAFALLLTISLSTATAKITMELAPTGGPCKYNVVPLGVQNGRISDSQITASSIWSATLSTRQARSNGEASWTARGRNENQWIQIDLGKEQVVTAVGTQGRSNADQWVKTYTVSYSSDGQNFDYYKINGMVMDFSANYDRNSVVKNVFSPAITVRYIRVHPKTWYSYISMRIELYGCSSETCKSGEVALGLQNGKIKDSEMTSSSAWSAALSTQKGRLNSPTSWSARRNDKNQWIQVDFGKEERVTAIATQGRSNSNQWVKSYSVSYSVDGKTFESYKVNGNVKVLTGNFDRYSIVTKALVPTIFARYIRIHPVSWSGHISMRFEVYGCYTGRCQAAETALGVENGNIRDSQLTASSIWNAALSTSKGRLNGAGSWSARRNDQNQWIQVDLGKNGVLTAIASQGRSNSNQWVKKYSVTYSLDGKLFKPYSIDGIQKVFDGNSDRGSVVVNVLSPPITARYVRIHPVTWQSHISMRIEVYGCTQETASPCKYGEVALGVETGKISNSQMKSSSSWNAVLATQKGRLYGPGSWSARVNDQNQWIQVDLGKEEVVTAIATQGRSNYNQWVKTFSVLSSLDGSTFEPYETDGRLKIFDGNSDRNTIIKNTLSPALTARYIRIKPVSWNGHISMRIEIYGCFKAPKPCDSDPCKNEGVCENKGDSFSCTCVGSYTGKTCGEYATPCSTHEVALGVETGKILNTQMTSSSAWSAALSTQQGRLNGPASWSARRNDQNQWIQVDLGRQEVVTAIATQGRKNYNQWVKSYYLSYSLDGESSKDYKALNGIKKEFTANSDRSSVVKNILSPAMTARYVRIHPVSWYGHISMRFEVYGCYIAPKPCDSDPCKNEGVCENQGDSFSCTCVGSYTGKTCGEYASPCSTHEVAFGVESGKILNAQMTSSSAWSAALSTQQGRLNGPASWSARRNDQNQWIQIDLGRKEVVTAIATQGRKNYNQWVKSYYLSYSLDGETFKDYKALNGIRKEFTANSDRSSIVKNILSPAMTARYVRIHPVSWYGHISMRFEVYGCYIAPKPCDSDPCKNEGVCENQGDSFSCTCVGSYTGKTCEEYASPCGTHEVALGVESGKILNAQMTSSSAWSAALSTQQGRLNGPASWSARRNDQNQWIQLDLGRQEVVTAIATQGRKNYNQWVKSYYLSYSLDGESFEDYKTLDGIKKVLIGNDDRNSIVKNVLSPAVRARYVRIHPLSWYGHISMRFEVYGCYREPEPCDSSPCKNNAECKNQEKSFSCKCRPYFIGLTCETELPNPCKSRPCQNGGECVVLGNHYSCRCKPEFGGVHCEHGQSLCYATGDPHYRSFDGLAFNFMGTCEYEFAKDCSSHKLFTVLATNQRCGLWVTCTAAVKIYIAGYHIKFTRARQTAIVNGVKLTKFPVIRPGFKIINPSVKWLTLTTDIGLTVSWDTTMALKVAVSGRFKGKICSSSLCGNNNGDRRDDNQFNRKCAPPQESCIPNSVTQPIIDKCHLMNDAKSPFRACNRLVDPTTLISDCKYDACRCTNPMQCVCASFATYSKQCAGYGAILDWRFEGTHLYEPLKECAQQCKNPGEIFTECGSSCAKTCRDLSSDADCSEECIPGCQCPENQVLDDNNRCVPVTECTCLFQGAVYQPGQSIKIGNCKSCTCNAGGMACVDDRDCGNKGPFCTIPSNPGAGCSNAGPCESFPCKNQGICTVQGDTFACECPEDYQGKTCEELKPKPCDSQPCKNDGICTNVGDSFSCECVGIYQGVTCEEGSSPCKPSPCNNGATCVDLGNKFSCKCPSNFIGATCEKELPDPCNKNPCRNGGICVPLGNRYSCRCPPEHGGSHCEHSQSSCYAQGDPHYISFDGRKFDFMGKCQYVFAQDCSENKLFTVYTKNQRCGWGGASCTAAVTVILANYKIQFSRAKRSAIVNGVKYTNFPIIRRGFTIANPRSLVLTADIGLTVTWDFKASVKVTVSGKYRGQLCPSSLCGNNNGNRRDDNQFDRKCAPPPGELVCFPTAENEQTINKCHLMNAHGSPFRACNSVIDPTELIANCRYDACRCQDSMECVCSSFAAYSKQCAAYGKVVSWRFQGTYLYPLLQACAQQCKNEGEIFTECGLSCARSCQDLSRDVKCNEECVAGCQCPNGQLLNNENRCVPVAQCPCKYGEKMIQPGESVSVGKCKTCTCNRGSMACTDDEDCESKGPCDSFPCQNGGVCSEDGSSFSCQCSEDYRGKTCDELKPKPCDSSPCKNGGVCSNKATSFACECTGSYQGKTCEEKKPTPCEPSPCKNGANCSESENSFSCKCPPGFIGKLCDQEPPNPCEPNPCQNGAKCEPLGNAFSCRCKDNTFGGSRCEYKQGTCEAHGDPHYTTFDKRKYNFQGPCSYVFAADCSAGKAFKVVTTNVKCGSRGATCTAEVTVYLNGNEIRLTREKRAVIINRIKIKTFPIRRPEYVITNPSKNWLRLTTSIGLTVHWDSYTIVRVSVAGKYHDKLCGLCGNFNGDKLDDVPEEKPECVSPPSSLVCQHEAATKNKCYMDLCNYLNSSASPFGACNAAVDPRRFINDCRYDSCKCDDPMQCVCNSFAAYSQRCSDNSMVLQWRFQGTYLFPPLAKCAQQCSSPDEIFSECSSSCARSCRDFSADLECREECVPGCHCPDGKVLNYAGRCVAPTECPCEFEGKIIEAGESADVGECTTCTCYQGAMTCFEDEECLNKGPCDARPCKNNGICSLFEDSFSCECTPEYQGKTCEELKPRPCDSSPCKNGGICTNEGISFSCECTSDSQGKTCEELKPRPCDSSPCMNNGICSKEGDSFRCKCTENYEGKTCKVAKCKNTKLDILYVVDGSGSVRKANFAKVKQFIQKLNARFDIGAQKTQIALMQFGEPVKTRLEFQLGEKNTLKEVNQGVEEMKFLRSQTATGDALRKSRQEVFNGQGNDRLDAPNVLLLFTDGQATDKQGKGYQVEQAKKLKDDGVEVITVGMGKSETIGKFRDKLRDMASTAGDTAAPLTFETDFQYLDSIINTLVEKACDSSN